MQKDKQKKAPDKPKKPEPKQKPKKKPVKRAAARQTLKVALAAMNAIVERNERRQRAIERAARLVRDMGFFCDSGNHLVLVERLKIMFAFDIEELLQYLQSHADVSQAKLIHIPAELFSNLGKLRRTIIDHIHQAKELNPMTVKITSKRKIARSKKSLDRNISRV